MLNLNHTPSLINHRKFVLLNNNISNSSCQKKLLVKIPYQATNLDATAFNLINSEPNSVSCLVNLIT
jgi:hypothetical protein